MNILLVRPRPHKDTVSLSNFAISEPLALEYLAAYAHHEGVDADILDMMVDKKCNIIDVLESKNYSLVAFSGSMTAINIINSVAKQVKEFDSNIVTVVGGLMAEANPFVFSEQYFDAVVKVDPLNTFREILQKLKNGERDFTSLNGVYHKDKTEYNFVRYAPEHFPMREKVAQYRQHYRYAYLGKCAAVKTSYGCPNRCNFCICTQAVMGKYWERDLEDVIEEIKTLDTDLVMLVDDNFTANMKRVEKFCDMLEEQKLNIKFSMLSTTDAVVKNENTIRRLAKNGLACVFLGIDGFDNADLKELNKTATVEQNVGALKLLSELKVDIMGGIICMPEWTNESFDSLIKNLKEFNPIIPMINALVPMLGTPIYDVYKDRIEADEKRFEIFDMAHLIVRPLNMSVRRFYINVLRVYKHTAYSKTTRKYIKDNFGKKEYKRHKKSSRVIFMQYIKMIIKGKM